MCISNESWFQAQSDKAGRIQGGEWRQARQGVPWCLQDTELGSDAGRCGESWQELGNNRTAWRIEQGVNLVLPRSRHTTRPSQWRITTLNNSSPMAMPRIYSSTLHPTRTNLFPARQHPSRHSTAERKHQHTRQVMAQASAVSLLCLDVWVNKGA